MKEVIAFLAALRENNNRPWFNAHKAEYLQAQARFHAFTEELVQAIGAFDASVAGLSVSDCTYRIYRDTRFTNDKTPYKIHMGAFIAPGGKRSGFAGYYLQVGARGNGYPGGNMLASGHYCFDATVLRILREDICYGEGDFAQIVEQAKPFRLDTSDSLKRLPAGFPANAPYAEFLRLRSFCLDFQPGQAWMEAGHLVERAAEAFRPTQPFIAYLNRAIAYTHEQAIGNR